MFCRRPLPTWSYQLWTLKYHHYYLKDVFWSLLSIGTWIKPPCQIKKTVQLCFLSTQLALIKVPLSLRRGHTERFQRLHCLAAASFPVSQSPTTVVVGDWETVLHPGFGYLSWPPIQLPNDWFFCRDPSEKQRRVTGRTSGLTCDPSYLPLKQSPHEASDVGPETDPDEVKGLQFASIFLLDNTVAVVSAEGS